MRLTFECGYDDYSDEKNWFPRLQELQTFAQELDGRNLRGMDNGTLLDVMEELEELMRFYTFSVDLKNLETVMRKQMEMIQIGRERGLQDIGYCYLEMEFLRANAMLFRNENKNRQAAEYYGQASQKAERCFEELQDDWELSNQQKVYVGWACVEVFSEAAQVYDMLMDIGRFIEYGSRMITVLEWLRPYMQDGPGLLEKAAEFYCTYGGVFYQNDMADRGKTCFETSVEMFRKLDERYDSDFWYARSIWVKGLYGLQEFLRTGDPRIMLTCESEAERGLAVRFEHPRDCAIAEAALGVIKVQKGTVLQQNGNLPDAIRNTEEACESLSGSLNILDKDKMDQSIYYQSVITAINARIFSCYVGALDMLGVQQYSSDRPDEAKASLEKAVDLLTKQTDYVISENASTLLRAECMQYLALIAMDEGNADEAEFYGTQAAALADTSVKHTGNPAAIGIIVTACAVVAEVCLAKKNKPKAAEYAVTGWNACEQLRKVSPQSPQLGLQSVLEKLKRKLPEDLASEQCNEKNMCYNVL